MKQSGLYRLRALKMIELRLRGKSLIAIGKEFGVSEQTVRRSMDWAERVGLVESFEDQILKDLVPVAMKTLKDAMETGNNADVALEVFKGIGLFKKHSDKNVTAGVEENLDDYLRNKRGALGAGSTTALPPAPQVRLLEGQLAEIGPENSPKSPAAVGPARDEDSTPDQIQGVDLADDAESEDDQFEPDL